MRKTKEINKIRRVREIIFSLDINAKFQKKKSENDANSISSR